MKRISLITITSLFVCIMVIIGCKTKKDINNDSVEIKTPFSENKYKSDKNHFRAVGYGESESLNNAQEIAKSQARSDILRQVSIIIKDVTERYNSQVGSNSGNMFQGISRQISKSVLTNIKEINNKTFELKNNNAIKYQYWTVLEVGTNDVYNLFDDITKEN